MTKTREQKLSSSRNCARGENRSKPCAETEKEVYLKRLGAHTIAKFLAGIIVAEQLPARQAKCLIRYSSVLESKSQTFSTSDHAVLQFTKQTSRNATACSCYCHGIGSRSSFPKCHTAAPSPSTVQPQPSAAPAVPPCSGADPIHSPHAAIHHFNTHRHHVASVRQSLPSHHCPLKCRRAELTTLRAAVF